MDPRPSYQHSARDADRRLRAAGLTSTPQRRAILRAIEARTDHPTPDAVFEALPATDAGISRTTVYRTLEAFVGAGLVRRVGHLEGGARYDPRVESHDHFLCEGCGAIRDLEPAGTRSLTPAGRSGLLAQGCEVYELSLLVRGRCAACR